MSDACPIEGHASMFGLGIRLGFYLQWFGVSLAAFLVPDKHRDHRIKDPIKTEIVALVFSIDVFSTAELLALAILLGSNASVLQPVEIYIVLLLSSGYTLTFVTIYIWRAVILFDASKDPTRWPINRPGSIQTMLRFIFVVAVASYQLWFWFSKVPELNSYPCHQYGFFFAQLPLDSAVMRGLNITIYLALLIICVPVAIARLLSIDLHLGQNRGQAVRPDTKVMLQRFYASMNLLTLSLVVMAIELTINWNHIRAINNIASAGQTIPLTIGAALVIRLVYKWLRQRNLDLQPERQRPYYYRDSSREYERTRRIDHLGAAPTIASRELPMGVRRDYDVDDESITVPGRVHARRNRVSSDTMTTSSSG